LVLEELRIPSVITIQEGDVLPFGQIEGYVTRMARAEVIGIDQLKAMIFARVLADFVCRGIRRTIVNYYILEISESLSENRVYGLANVLGHVICWRNDSYPR
jgi:hypothetical protein